MKRETLCLVGGLVLSAAVIGWLWNENQSLRGRLTGRDDAGGHTVTGGGKLASSSRDDGASTSEKRRSDSSRSNHFRGDQQRPKQETTAGEVSVVRTEDTTRSSHRKEKSLAVNEPQQSMTTVALPDSTAESLLKNGGFDKELAPWVCENGKITQDPDDPENTVLEVRLDDPGFRLSQTFRPASGKRDLTLSLRIKAQEPKEHRGFEFGLHFFTNGGKTPIYTTRISAGNTEKWTAIPLDLSVLLYMPDRLVIDSATGSGTVWIDDVTLK